MNMEERSHELSSFRLKMPNTFHITNFGCRASQSEGASIQQELLEANAAEAASPYDAEVVIVNSCTVTAEADRDVRQTIRRIASRNPRARIIVTGCYAQRAPEELAALPQVRYVVGNSHKPLVAELALEARSWQVRNLLQQHLSRTGIEARIAPGFRRPHARHREGSGWLQCQLLVLHHSVGSRPQPKHRAGSRSRRSTGSRRARL